jgi:oligopeptide transport system substrate-binding protein
MIKVRWRWLGLLPILVMSLGCDERPLNNPYPSQDDGKNVLYSSFSERPKHLDPAISYSANEYSIISQTYEPPLQYHYLKRPYTLEPNIAEGMPTVIYLDGAGRTLPEDTKEQDIAYSDYVICIKKGVRFQPHPAFAQAADGAYRYHALDEEALQRISTIGDFEQSGERELTAEDYIYQIKRLVHPQIHSPIAEMMKHYIVGMEAFAQEAEQRFRTRPPGTTAFFDLRALSLPGVEALDRYTYKIRIHGKYPQFRFWLAMPFFAPMAWEADAFYAQPGLTAKNITLDWFPVGTGAYMLTENNPNRRIVLVRNPNFHPSFYPAEGEPADAANGYLRDAGKKLPLIDKVVFTLEREIIPYWNKFLQGYYDASSIASDNFDQAIQFTAQGDVELTAELRAKNIQLQTAVTTSIFYMGFNMLDAVVGGYGERARKLRQAVSIAVDYEEYISIFQNGRGVVAQGILPPDIFGYLDGEAGINPYSHDWVDGAPRRKNIEVAKRLLAEAGYPGGRDIARSKPLVLYLDTVARGPDDKAILDWYRKQFAKLGIQLVLRTTDYNQFQQKMLTGNAQIFMWGWNADYPDPENFFFLLYGPNAKVEKGGENAVNYKNAAFDRLFEKTRNMDDSPERLRLIQELQEIIRRDAPWIFGFHPKSFALYHDWYRNLKPNLMANNETKYQHIDAIRREAQQRIWNQPAYWPIPLGIVFLLILLFPAWFSYRRRMRATVT